MTSRPSFTPLEWSASGRFLTSKLCMTSTLKVCVHIDLHLICSVHLSKPRMGLGHPLSPCPFTSLSFAFFIFPFLSGFNYFLLLSIPFLSTRIVPLHFQAGGRRKRPNLGLVCCVILCSLYSLVKMDFGALLYLV